MAEGTIPNNSSFFDAKTNNRIRQAKVRSNVAIVKPPVLRLKQQQNRFILFFNWNSNANNNLFWDFFLIDNLENTLHDLRYSTRNHLNFWKCVWISDSKTWFSFLYGIHPMSTVHSLTKQTNYVNTCTWILTFEFKCWYWVTARLTDCLLTRFGVDILKQNQQTH